MTNRIQELKNEMKNCNVRYCRTSQSCTQCTITYARISELRRRMAEEKNVIENYYFDIEMGNKEMQKDLLTALGLEEK